NQAIRRGCISSGVYRSGQEVFPLHVLENFDAGDTLAFFESMGLYTKARDGYVYPMSEQAASVRDILCWELAEQKADVVTGQEVKKIRVGGKGLSKGGFTVYSVDNVYQCRKLIMACGGASASKLGSNGSGYRLAECLGHHVSAPVPALCALHCKEKYFKELAGIRLQGRVRLLTSGKVAAEDSGEIQLTAYGISGIPVFQVSRYAAKALQMKKTVTAVLDLMPAVSDKGLRARLMWQMHASPKWTMRMVLSGMMNSKLAACLLKCAGIDGGQPCCKVDDRALERLIALVKHHEVHINATNDFEQSQATAGGVDTREIDEKNMASKIVRGLYFTGELLDVDGICGGYNLQWAWATGILAGSDAGRSCRVKG
ncbi:MAG: aminoacetone oxidase family FAD-binding enzyme, partial [Coprococcus sp.]